MNQLDIIIPVYNRASVLAHTLSHLFAQSVPANWQVQIIIIDDGSTEDMSSTIHTLTPPPYWPPIMFIQQSHTGIATARNRGLEAGRGQVVLFLGADILLSPTVVQQHIHVHEQHPQTKAAVLGGIAWDPNINPSPLMDWLIHGGPQNDFDALLGQTQADPNHFFYGSHISLKRDLLPAQLFPESYQGYGWEDFAAGRKLHKEGIQLYVLHSAIGHHHHIYNWSDFCRRQYQVGKNYPRLAQDYPELAPQKLTTVRQIKIILLYGSGLYAILWGLLFFSSRVKTTPDLFTLMGAAQFWRGVWKGQKQAKKPVFRPLSHI